MILCVAASLLLAAVSSCSHPSPPVAAAGSAVVAAGACEVGALQQTVKSDGGTILSDIISAVLTGGATLPALFTSLVVDFGEPTIACAANLVNDIVPLLASVSATGSGSGMKLAPPPPGLAVLKAEIAKRGWAKTK